MSTAIVIFVCIFIPVWVLIGVWWSNKVSKVLTEIHKIESEYK